MIVRSATSDDAPKVASVHVRSWQAAYRGQLPDRLLDGLSVDRRTEFWRSFIESGRSGEHVLVVEGAGGIEGFAHAGVCRDRAEPDGTGEISSLYLAPEAWGKGRGRRLMEECVAVMAADARRRAVLWVLVSNARARRFYELAGWTCDFTVKAREIAGTTVTETRYRRPL